MSKVYISADIEGVCGIADWKETELTDHQGAYFREQMTREVKAACEGFLEAGAGELFLKDAHSTGRNIDPLALPESVRIMRAWTRDPYCMMAGLDGTYAAAAMVGYHSGAGSNGNPLAHTLNGDPMRVLINGEEASEFLINAYTAASMGVPVVLVTGDQALCERVKALNPAIRTVPVNEGLGNATISIHPHVAVARIHTAAAEGLRNAEACRIPLPKAFELAIEFKPHWMAHRGSFYPGARQEGPRTVGFSCTEWLDALRFLYFVLM